jgi:4-hydroxybenzoate polyprenyltransferase
LWAYFRTRFPPWLALLLPLLLVVAALQQRILSPALAAVAFGMAFLLMLELRLWDDLCDLPHDRQIHPERILCQSRSLWPFWGLLVLLATINSGLAAVLRGWWAAALLLGLHALLAAWYGLRDRMKWGPVTNYHVVLLKYPAIVWILGATKAADLTSTPLALSAAAVYLTMCLIEAGHDPSLRQLRSAQICLAVECLLLAAVGCLAVSTAGWLSY